MTKTKVALLGAGFIADIHLESYHRFVPEAEVVAVYTRDPQRAEAFARKHGIPRWFNELEQAISDSGCDVVDVCIPNFLHRDAVIAAAKAGKHVIIEKPLCLTLEEADEMIMSCIKAGRAPKTTRFVSPSSMAAPSVWPKTVGPSTAGWTTASRCMGRAASFMPIFSRGIRRSLTAKTDMVTPWRKPARPRVGRS